MESNLAGIQKVHQLENTMWKKIRSAAMFGVACITSPCCTPLIAPLGLAILAEMPVALFPSCQLE